MTESVNASTDMPQRWVRCPTCAKDALYHPSNPHRPFCSAVCRQIDFGAWASEEYAVPTAPVDHHEPDADA